MEKHGGMGVAPGDRLGYNLLIVRTGRSRPDRMGGRWGVGVVGGGVDQGAAQYARERGRGRVQMEDNE